ncbi:MAG: hypothetical protein IPK26_22735 [Planctomycetes bacterium]|nr:hypothetical protein [Planctomycetota bacterium]
MIEDGVDWIDAATLEHFRTWASVGNHPFLDVHRAHDLARDLGLGYRLYGRFQGEPGAEDALLHRCALLVLADMEPLPGAVVIARDDDGRQARRLGFVQAESDRAWPFAIIGAIATPEIESWLISAFVPRTPEEERNRDELRETLGFDPIQEAHRLSSTGSPKRDAKAVLSTLAGTADAGAAFVASSLEHLRTQGTKNGLTRFLDALATKLLPLFDVRHRRS